MKDRKLTLYDIAELIQYWTDKISGKPCKLPKNYDLMIGDVPDTDKKPIIETGSIDERSDAKRT